jgi:hypothetical protein
MDYILATYKGSKQDEIFLNTFLNTLRKLHQCFYNMDKNCKSCKKKSNDTKEVIEYKNENMTQIWKILHELSFVYLVKPSNKMKKLVLFLLNVELAKIPCDICKTHYINYIKTTKFEKVYDTKMSFIRWLIDLHNHINERNHKPILSYEEVFKLYKYDYNKCIEEWK